MKAFVSYSVTDNNEFILTLLASKLREKKFSVTTSQNFYSNILDYNTTNEINDSHLFIGIITGHGIERGRVLEEWRYAAQRSIPNILLIEDAIPIDQNFNGNYVRFNKRNPQQAINEITKRMTPTQVGTTSSADEIVPWILGGAALLAVLALFGNKK